MRGINHDGTDGQMGIITCINGVFFSFTRDKRRRDERLYLPRPLWLESTIKQ